MYIGCGRLSIINTEGQMRIFLMTPVGVVLTTHGRERVNENSLETYEVVNLVNPFNKKIQTPFRQ